MKGSEGDIKDLIPNGMKIKERYMQTKDRQIKKIAIRGVAGCFHDAAASSFSTVRSRNDTMRLFPRSFREIETDASMLGIVAIENTIAGSLLANHELRKSNHTIIGSIP